MNKAEFVLILRSAFQKSLIPIVVVVGLSCILFIAFHNSYRASLNDPQIQIVEDVIYALREGSLPAEVVPRETLDISRSYTPFVGIYDIEGVSVAVSAIVGGKVATPPKGVFEYAFKNGENRVTWEPQVGTRIALVVRPVGNDKGWFVASGRNMRESEARIGHIGLIIFLGSLVLILVIYMIEAGLLFLRYKKH